MGCVRTTSILGGEKRRRKRNDEEDRDKEENCNDDNDDETCRTMKMLSNKKMTQKTKTNSKNKIKYYADRDENYEAAEGEDGKDYNDF